MAKAAKSASGHGLVSTGVAESMDTVVTNPLQKEIEHLKRRVHRLENDAKSHDLVASIKRILERHGIRDNPELDEIEAAHAAGEPEEVQQENPQPRQ